MNWDDSAARFRRMPESRRRRLALGVSLGILFLVALGWLASDPFEKVTPRADRRSSSYVEPLDIITSQFQSLTSFVSMFAAEWR